MRKTTTLLVLLGLISCLYTPSFAQLKSLDHSDYDHWKDIKRQAISNDGDWVMYEINPGKGDGNLTYERPSTDYSVTIPRAYKASFSPENDFLVYQIKPQADSLRMLKLAKAKKDKFPHDTLQVVLLNGDSIFTYADVKNYKVADRSSSWVAIAFQKKKDEKPKKEMCDGCKKAGKKCKKCKKKHKHDQPVKEKAKIKYDGSELLILNPLTTEQMMFENVSEFNIGKNGALVGIIKNYKKDTLDYTEVSVFNTRDQSTRTVLKMLGKSKSIQVDAYGEQIAFLSTSDTAKDKLFDLYYWNLTLDSALTVVDTLSPDMPGGFGVSEYGRIYFSEDATRIFFGTSERPDGWKKDTLLPEEKVHLDIWNWKDKRLQPNQLSELKRDMRKSYLAVYHIYKGDMVQLENDTIENVRVGMMGNADVAFAKSYNPYMQSISWEWPVRTNTYAIDINRGRAIKVITDEQYNVAASPDGKYHVWFEPNTNQWYSINVYTRDTTNLSKGIPHPLQKEEWDVPMEASPYGIAAWIENNDYVLIQDRFDLWKCDPNGILEPVCLTRGYGRRDSIELTFIDLDREKEYISRDEDIYFKAFKVPTKQGGFYKMSMGSRDVPKQLVLSNAKYIGFMKAKEDDQFIFRKMTYREFPDLWYTGLDFTKASKLTTANPQQKDYKWGNVELVKWKTEDGTTLEGLLYKPENFDPNKKYPMIVYFYERYSHTLYDHRSPKPSRSTVYPSYYVSNDYVMFIPDIVYKTGYPGQSGYDCIVSGTEHILKMGFVDKDRVGIQGQSWGGYQTAFLVTKTNMYKAAMAGAPVSNMTSAYGGIRWTSGLSRMFQYEVGQSRIGGTLWDKQKLYIENSPLFGVPNVKTPLLIMHNDGDGAVPWYQGIELFVAMRRLNKPCWLLNYNGEEHNLTKRPNKVDLSIRMQQFFDHYLKDKPMPEWMKKGRKAVDKNEKTGY